MRWIFIGIVVLNLGYLAWHLVSPRSAINGESAFGVDVVEFPRTLQLLGEPEAVLDAAAGPGAGLAVIVGCPAIGPLSEADARLVAGALAEADFPAGVRLVDVAAAPVFWVYLPPAETREAALRRLRELHARSIDSFVVSDGEFARAISLGSFQSRASAVGVKDRLKAAGYEAEIREQVKDVKQVWVVLSDATAQGFLEPLPKSLLGAAHVERLACEAR